MHFTASRLKIISDIVRDIAQVFFASAFVVPIVNGEAKLFFIIGGLLLSLAFWYWSIALIRE
ncbi:MAG: hypothetical protein HYT41_00875 [Candidatus Sungbacteria bacterium]|nr:hypothetical protein [Candidatus Sungbacteria bacterium]